MLLTSLITDPDLASDSVVSCCVSLVGSLFCPVSLVKYSEESTDLLRTLVSGETLEHPYRFLESEVFFLTVSEVENVEKPALVLAI